MTKDLSLKLYRAFNNLVFNILYKKVIQNNISVAVDTNLLAMSSLYDFDTNLNCYFSYGIGLNSSTRINDIQNYLIIGTGYKLSDQFSIAFEYQNTYVNSSVVNNIPNEPIVNNNYLKWEIQQLLESQHIIIKFVELAINETEIEIS